MPLTTLIDEIGLVTIDLPLVLHELRTEPKFSLVRGNFLKVRFDRSSLTRDSEVRRIPNEPFRTFLQCGYWISCQKSGI